MARGARRLTPPGPSPIRVLCIGEAMVELSRLDLGAGTAALGVAGDTFNMAVSLARLLGPGGVAYATVLGRDALSDGILAAMAAEGIDAALVGRHPSRLPGLYAIELDAAGERSFRYWRDASAARTLFSEGRPTLDDLAGFDLLLLSGITLAILVPDAREALLDRLAALRALGARVAFDGNHRARLWPDAATARAAMDRAWALADFALPSLDDERALRPDLAPEEACARIEGLGAAEVALKDGARGPLLLAGGRSWRPEGLPKAEQVVDSSGAGDAFGAAYLAARLRAASPEAAARAGHALALAVIARHGAVIPRDAMPPESWPSGPPPRD